MCRLFMAQVLQPEFILKKYISGLNIRAYKIENGKKVNLCFCLQILFYPVLWHVSRPLASHSAEQNIKHFAAAAAFVVVVYVLPTNLFISSARKKQHKQTHTI